MTDTPTDTVPEAITQADREAAADGLQHEGDMQRDMLLRLGDLDNPRRPVREQCRAGVEVRGVRYTQFSGGDGSFRTAKLDRLLNPGCEQRLVFADVLYEDADTYRFLIEGACHVLGRDAPRWLPHADDFPTYMVAEDVPLAEYAGNPEWRAYLADLRDRAQDHVPELIWLVEGRDPWEIYRDERFLGNSSADPCSKILKRQTIDAWRKANCSKNDTFAVGIGEHERHRLIGTPATGDKPATLGLQQRMAAQGWQFHSPLLDRRAWQVPGGPTILNAPLAKLGIAPPRLYAFDYKHGNCGGKCCKAGIAHWQNRFRRQPDRFHYDRMMERKVREYLGNPAATFLRDRRNKGNVPMSLDALHRRMIGEPNVTYEYEPGTSGCGCALDEAA